MRFNYRSVAAAVALGCAVGTTQTALAQETPQREESSTSWSRAPFRRTTHIARPRSA